MEILVEISEGADGRLAGTVRALDRQDANSFSGTMEFLAAIEGLCRAAGTNVLDGSRGAKANPYLPKGKSDD
jgi:hypothetical protein